MSFLLDTNVVSTYLKRPASLAHRFDQYSGRLFLPTVALAELYVAAHRHVNPRPMLLAIETVVRNEVAVLDFDVDCALVFGAVRASRLSAGVTVQVMDLLVASVALVHDLTVVTNNTSHFALIPGLRLVDWSNR